MFYRTRVLAAAFVAVAGIFSGAAFGQSIEGVVRGPDGKPLKDAEVRVEQKGNKSVVTTKTDAGGHYSHARLSPGVYKVSVVLGGAEKSSVNVKTTTTNSRIDFDLKPAAAKRLNTMSGSRRVPEVMWEAVGSKWMTRGETCPEHLIFRPPAEN
jgi:hypothetical protein